TRGALPRQPLRKRRRAGRVEDDLALDLLHDLVNVAVQHCDRAEAPQQRQGLLGVLRRPAPFLVDRPQGHVREHDHGGVSRQPGTEKTFSTRTPLSTWATVSNSSGLARWVRSPVCSRKAGASGSLLIRAMASVRVPVTSLFGSFLKPMWLSLICTNEKSVAA